MAEKAHSADEQILQNSGVDGQDDEKKEQDAQKSKTKSDKKSKKTLSTKKVKSFQEKLEKRGVVYLSRIPPYMKPDKVRHLLGQFGNVDRVYLKLEDPFLRRLRKKSGGNGKKNFTEGWVEFLDKEIAESVALSLNNTPIGGRARSWYKDDIWNIKYLPGFKWTDLHEEAAYKKAVRNEKLRAEIDVARKERDFYLSRVEKAKELEAIEAKKSEKARNAGQQQESDDKKSKTPKKRKIPSSNGEEQTTKKVKRTFKQQAPVAEDVQPNRSEDLQLMKKIFM